MCISIHVKLRLFQFLVGMEIELNTMKSYYYISIFIFMHTYLCPYVFIVARNVSDALRLYDVLLVIAIEGREALKNQVGPFRRLESSMSDLSHRQIIEHIRSGNTDEFLDIMEAGTV